MADFFSAFYAGTGMLSVSWINVIYILLMAYQVFLNSIKANGGSLQRSYHLEVGGSALPCRQSVPSLHLPTGP